MNNTQLVTPVHRWEDNINVGIKERECAI